METGRDPAEHARLLAATSAISHCTRLRGPSSECPVGGHNLPGSGSGFPDTV